MSHVQRPTSSEVNRSLCRTRAAFGRWTLDIGRGTVIPVLFLTFSFAGCLQSGSEKPSPEASKQFLKLRGYDFDEKSFLAAAAASDVMAVNGFLAAGMNPNVRDGVEGDTALMAAASRGDTQVVKALLRGGANLNEQVRGWTAFLLALTRERDEVANELVVRPELDLKAQAPNGMTALMLAVWHEQSETVARLLERGADVNHRDNDGDASLHGAAFRGNCFENVSPAGRQDELRSLTCIGERAGPADASARASNDGDFSCETCVHVWLLTSRDAGIT